MPMNWTAEADAKLMATIVQVCNVRLTGDQMKEVANAMGSECTPKAITHRMAHFRKLGGTGKEVKAADGEEKPKKAATKAKKTTAASKKNGSKGTNVKKEDADRTPSPAGDGDGQLTPPDTGRSKRAGSKRNYAELAGENNSDDDADEEQDDGLDKKVKIEVGEDIGEGLRQGAEDED
ncbi:hypothetical protein LTR37_008166 [Vermiconidia calcicola]|uniref:Uncharacterized protein n=1 Tax=Vermiconidia calcicola TaxID=1690605 RepID=A0ACC3NBE2_9PEZI|nr:hypothetical protein LTR37_008166 [Vermiconidia calcicola]